MQKFGHFWTTFFAIKILLKHSFKQHANKIMSGSPWLGLVDFALRLVNSVLHFVNLHDGLVNFLENSNHRRTVIRGLQKFSLGFRWMHLKWLLGYRMLSTLCMCNLPRWQAVKLTFSHPVSIKFISFFQVCPISQSSTDEEIPEGSEQFHLHVPGTDSYCIKSHHWS